MTFLFHNDDAVSNRDIGDDVSICIRRNSQNCMWSISVALTCRSNLGVRQIDAPIIRLHGIVHDILSELTEQVQSVLCRSYRQRAQCMLQLAERGVNKEDKKCLEKYRTNQQYRG